VGVVDLRVRYAETDQMGVVYHANYLVWCEIGRTDFIRLGGTSYAEIERTGSVLAVADASLRYHAPARYDDRIRVETRLSELRSRTITFDYLVVNADSGERLVTARTVLISLDSSGRPRALPPEVRDLLARAMAG
jgi:acyl-CoA thioester hydrolase